MTPVPWKMFDYELDEYPFPTLVRETLDVQDLGGINVELPLRTWQTDQQTPWHRDFYTIFPMWRSVYDRFVREVIAPRVGEPCYYQNVPTFRVHLPGNLAVGEFHTDAVYHHPSGEVTFWVPLTDAYDTCSVWVVDDEDEPRAVLARPGEVVEFSAVDRLHGNRINDTGRSRVSFDFRCLPVRLLPDEAGPPTKHTKMKFVPGEYYAAEAVG